MLYDYLIGIFIVIAIWANDVRSPAAEIVQVLSKRITNSKDGK